MTNLLGAKIANGRYEVKHLLGEGGMAEVYEAFQPKLNRQVAIKLMHRHLSNDEQFKARFEREAMAIAQLKHPNIIQLYDFDLDPDLRQYFMVIEFIDGPTLGEYLKQIEGRLPLAQSVRIIDDLANALGYAHAAQMVHRDIKPSNIMLDRGTRTVLTDFGIAKIVQEAGQQLTASGAMVGTPAYISPEQAVGKPGDHRSDIYSLGVVFFQMVTGQLPYQGDTPIATILKHIKEPPPSPSKFNADLPIGVEAIILRCLAKDPRDRYQTTGDLLKHLRNLEVAASEIELTRTISGKVLDDSAFLADTLTYTPTSSTALNPVVAGLAGTQMTQTLTVAPRRTTFLIGAGTIAIIALLTLGAFLFSTAGDASSSPTPGMSMPSCLVQINAGVEIYWEPNTNAELLIFGQDDDVLVVGEQDGFWQVEVAGQTAWIEQTDFRLPEECTVSP
jgi:serine/threonine protein kinase